MKNRLIPILTYAEDYALMTTSPGNYSDEVKTSTFTSYGRLTPCCIYTQFIGPTTKSKQITVGTVGSEAIFGKLPDYTYIVSWKYENYTPANFWRINFARTKAYQLYTTEGRSAELNTDSGCFIMFGYDFPIVLEIPINGEITLTITLGDHLIKRYPLNYGEFCYNGNTVYKNVKGLKYPGNIVRHVNPPLEDYNNCIREKYFSNYRSPCESVSVQSGGSQILIIDDGQTVTDYGTKIVVTLGDINCTASCWFILSEGSTTQNFVQLTDTLHIEKRASASYGQVISTVDVTISFNVTFEYYGIITQFSCNLTDTGIGAYSSTNGVLVDDKGGAVIIRGQFNGTDKVTFEGSFLVKIVKGDNLWFGGYGLTPYISEISDKIPKSITGSITIT